MPGTTAQKHSTLNYFEHFLLITAFALFFALVIEIGPLIHGYLIQNAIKINFAKVFVAISATLLFGSLLGAIIIRIRSAG